LPNVTLLDIGQLNKARATRTRTIGIRVTEAEYLGLQREASERNQTVSEWGRHKILGASSSPDGVLSRHIFTELVGLQLLLMNALRPLLRGEHMLAEEIEQLNRQVQAIKRTKAQELLAKRTDEPHK
jgi:hypothetical protein